MVSTPLLVGTAVLVGIFGLALTAGTVVCALALREWARIRTEPIEVEIPEPLAVIRAEWEAVQVAMDDLAKRTERHARSVKQTEKREEKKGVEVNGPGERPGEFDFSALSVEDEDRVGAELLGNWKGSHAGR